ncbi:flagellar basal body-associated FliL family protein [Histidinibacterium lentulum]|uniref:Flagellar protein FliL n=1 Tax=Histidinibacterium lentulum TaxID=2480588 RepID=A0A3N2R7D9_9RHOB|nr:flagellar basal body-associated FliL family protein [Histidinibacterium lentulum]ROU03236.1 flagellar basal body protein FliL [Histidinibacterium lentulum]
MSDTIADATQEPSEGPPRRRILPLILGLILAVAGAGGGFFAARSGMLPFSGGAGDPASREQMLPLAPVAFVALDPLVIALPGAQNRQHLRFTAQLEVPPDQVAAVEMIRPRIVDVLNGYLRAVDLTDLEDPSALIRLRAQMLRRIQVVAGEGRVNDLLIMEFVLN